MYRFNSRIRYSECDSQCKLRLESLLNYFQDASTFQSEELGAGFEYLEPRNLVWVLASWQIDIKRYPALGERVVIGTHPHDFKGFLGSRNFCMMTEEGEMLAQANSLWTLLNFDTMKPTMAPKELTDKYEVEPPLEMEYVGRKIRIEGEAIPGEPIVVRKQHLDSNYHVNNAQYVSMAVDCLPEGFLIGGLRVEYKKQAHLNDVLLPYVTRQDNRIVVSLQDEAGAVYVNAEFIE
ncbi:MAG: acyl-[acyl-carrier-protein] thioesterase [Lachnospiraceae bacterium]|nr:acyl-[acyl-carrier-protein] thioesterase [Lachnospiraceae bacterium]